MKNGITKYLAILILALTFSIMANAQPGSDPGGFGDDPNDVPLDGGIIILAIASASYGIKKLNSKK